jgi:hypothetical protein
LGCIALPFFGVSEGFNGKRRLGREISTGNIFYFVPSGSPPAKGIKGLRNVKQKAIKII